MRHFALKNVKSKMNLSNTVSSSKVNLNSDLSLVLPLFLIPLQVIVGRYWMPFQKYFQKVK